MPNKISAVVFDLDGTLADTFPVIIAAWNAAVKEPLGRTFSPEEVIARFGEPEAAMLAHEVPPAALPAAVDEFHRYYEEHFDMIEVFEGIPETLSALHAAGLPLGLMTGKGLISMEITLRKLRWTGLFGSAISGDDVANQKPAPDGPLRVAAELGLPPADCLFVGDTPADVTAGRDAGMRTAAAAWHPVYLDQLRGCGADFWLERPADLLPLVLG